MSIDMTYGMSVFVRACIYLVWDAYFFTGMYKNRHIFHWLDFM